MPEDSRADSPIAGALRTQTAIDLGSALVITMLLWPFPVARAMLSVPVHVLSILAVWYLVLIAYFSVTCGVWGQTGGMRLMGIVFTDTSGDAVNRGRRAQWGAIAGALVCVRLLVPLAPDGTPGPVERLAGVSLVRG
ncbi:MAG: hypothetical protein HGB10_03160 [Coriobacteriia bacterium]|nr:hypothetical protein [Coriobacteriia bacterium]